MSSSATHSRTRYSISEAARLLDRSPQTLRSWDRNGSMPEELRPQRDEQGNRYWTPELVRDIKKWIKDNHFHPGRGISYNPSPAQLKQHINRIRKSSAKPGVEEPAPLADLRSMIEHAVTELGVSQEQVADMLAKVSAERGIPLSEALRIAGEVFSGQ